ncbi:hypothetical protein BpHYR1_040983 [Brachionus plicatilis]|uniref:Uncharacterized protein n=1 Tax=Brachionus plicatilis TaxID=10195 RepID=A0A3M7R6B4_BRAPC|nr:hypothetical protein BpHYR1_040983 [Brachionus plicatilis]
MAKGKKEYLIKQNIETFKLNFLNFFTNSANYEKKRFIICFGPMRKSFANIHKRYINHILSCRGKNSLVENIPWDPLAPNEILEIKIKK